MGKYGRPKAPKEKRRDAKAYNVRYSEEEDFIVVEKATVAGVTTTEWIRTASLERQPKSKRVIPEINQLAFLKLSKLIEAATEGIWKFEPGEENDLHKTLSELKQEAGSLQKILMGELQ